MNCDEKIPVKEDTDYKEVQINSIAGTTDISSDSANDIMNEKDFEIDEVMEFIRFSVKPSSTFEGTIVFRFKHEEEAKDATIYAVNIDESREVTTEKNADALPKNVVCEVGMSVDDFLWIYSGKASPSDVVKLYYSGRLAVSAFALRQLSTFASSFDYSPEKWKEFYAWREEQEQVAAMELRSMTALEDKNNRVGSVSRDFWLHRSHLILTRYKLSKLQRMQWEISLASMFGENFVVGRVLDAVGLYGRKSSGNVTTNQVTSVKITGARSGMVSSAEEMERLVFHLVHEVTSCRQVAKTRLRRVNRQLSHLSTAAGGTSVAMADVEKSLKHDYFHPSKETLNSLIETLNLTQRDVDNMEIFDFVDDEYVDAVKLSSRERIRKIQVKNRIDLADAGMKQLDRLLQQVVQKLQPMDTKKKAKSKYIPAPDLFLREIRRQAMEVIELVQEKALGRKSVEKIPTPNVKWALDTSKTLIRLQPIATSASGSSTSAALDVQQQQTRIPLVQFEDGMMGGDQFVLPRRSFYTTSAPKKREFGKTQKLAIKRTLKSMQREINARNESIDALSMAEDNLIFSDYG